MWLLFGDILSKIGFAALNIGRAVVATVIAGVSAVKS